MRNPSNLIRKLLFGIGIFLSAISAFIWLALILAIVRNPVNWAKLVIGGALLTFIPIGLGIFCLKHGRRPVFATTPEVVSSGVKDRVETQSLPHTTSGRRQRLLFWLGVVLLSISALFWLLILGTSIPEINMFEVTLGGILITFVPIGLGIYCVMYGRRAVSMALPEETHSVAKGQVETQVISHKKTWLKHIFSRGNALLLGVMLVAVGTGLAIMVLPEIFFSIVLFALIGGSGILIGFIHRNVPGIFLGGFGVAAWGYAFIAVGFFGKTLNDALLIDSVKLVVPVAVLGTLAVAWLGRKKLAPDDKTLTAFNKVAIYTLLIVTPFIVGGIHDYNRRADTNPLQVVTVKVVDKYTRLDPWDDYNPDLLYILRCDTLDGRERYEIDVNDHYYEEHDIGSLCEIKIRSGALGYKWMEGYK